MNKENGGDCYSAAQEGAAGDEGGTQVRVQSGEGRAGPQGHGGHPGRGLTPGAAQKRTG